jgi:hypothetical protein
MIGVPGHPPGHRAPESDRVWYSTGLMLFIMAALIVTVTSLSQEAVAGSTVTVAPAALMLHDDSSSDRNTVFCKVGSGVLSGCSF